METQSSLPNKGGSIPIKFSAHFYCAQTAGCIKMPLGMDFGLSPGDSVLDGDPVTLPKIGGGAPLQIFGPCLLWPNGWVDQDTTWHEGRPQPRRLCVRWGLSPLPTKGVEPPPQFSAHFYCGQTAGCIKMPLGMDVGLSPGDFVLDGDPVPSPKRGGAPLQIFGPCLLWPNGWMDQDATWHEGRPQPRQLCIR